MLTQSINADRSGICNRYKPTKLRLRLAYGVSTFCTTAVQSGSFCILKKRPRQKSGLRSFLQARSKGSPSERTALHNSHSESASLPRCLIPGYKLSPPVQPDSQISILYGKWWSLGENPIQYPPRWNLNKSIPLLRLVFLLECYKEVMQNPICCPNINFDTGVGVGVGSGLSRGRKGVNCATTFRLSW